MRFQVMERVSSADSERVLVVLEQQLRRKMSGGDVEREGSRLVLWGLGASPRTLNPRDKAVIDVATQEGSTLIEADVVFQASSLLAPVGQEELVRSKLLRIIGATRRQLEEEQEWLEMERRERLEAAESSSVRLYAARRFADSGQERVFRKPQPLQQEAVEEAKVSAEVEQPVAALPMEDAPVAMEDAVKTSAAVEASAIEVRDEALPEPIKSSPANEKTDNAAMGQRGRDETVEASSQRSMRERGSSTGAVAEREAGSAARRSWPRWMAAAAGVIVIASVAWQMREKPRPAPVIDLTKEVASTPVRPVAAEMGPDGALRQWEVTLSSNDAAAQTAYYAMPVDEYMWKHKVDRRTLQAMKQKEIDRRGGQWTVQVEGVDLKRNGDTADVTLVKHVTEQPQNGGKLRERFIHSQLKLKNSLGIWWITSERDIYPAKKPTGDDEDNFNPDEGETPDWAKPSPTSVAAGAKPSSSSTN